jgi:dienelactone hydrolase
LRSLTDGSGAAIDDHVAAHDHLTADARCTGKVGSGGPLRIIEHIAGLAYSEPAAEDAWQRNLTFFDEHLT